MYAGEASPVLSSGTVAAYAHTEEVVNAYAGKVNAQTLDFLFDGSNLLSPRDAVCAPVWGRSWQSGDDRSVVFATVAWRESIAKKPSSLPAGIGALDESLNILNGFSAGAEICHELGAKSCSLKDLQSKGITFTANPVVDPVPLGECAPDWTWFLHIYKGSEVRIEETLANHPYDAAYVVAHELTHALQMKSYPSIVEDKTAYDENAYLMEKDALLTNFLVAHDMFNGADAYKATTPGVRATALRNSVVLYLWRAKKAGLPLPPVPTTYTKEQLYVYNYLLHSYDAYTNSGEYLEQMLDLLTAATYTNLPANSGSREFAIYVRNRIRQADHDLRIIEDIRTDEIRQCLSVAPNPRSRSEAFYCDFLMEPWGVRADNYQLAAEDLCECYGNTRATRAPDRMDYCEFAAERLRVSLFSLDENSRYQVRARFDSSSCPSQLLYFVQGGGVRMDPDYLAYALRHNFHFDHQDTDSIIGGGGSSSGGGSGSPGGFDGLPGNGFDGEGGGGVAH